MPSAETSLESHLRNQRMVLNQSDHSGLSLLLESDSDPSLNQTSMTPSQLSYTSSGDQMRQPLLPSSSFSLVGDALASSPHVQYSLFSKPSTLSLGSRETLSHQISGMQRNAISDLPVDCPYLHSLQTTLPLKTAALASTSIVSLASETSQNNSTNQHLIGSAERYQYTENSTKEEDQQYGPWKEVRSNEVYELHGSERPHEKLIPR